MVKSDVGNFVVADGSFTLATLPRNLRTEDMVEEE